MLLRRLVYLVLALNVAACGDKPPPGLSPSPTDPRNLVQPGQTEFVTIEPEYSYGRYDADAQAGASADGKESAGPPAPGGRTGTVEEADIYRVDNNRLFYLNTYKGFIIYDLADPAAPKRVSRLPVYGYPIEMFVTGKTVYALLRDALYLTQGASGLRFARHNVSQLVAIDISDLANPKVLKRVDIIGELREGVSRKIDDTIYVLSYLPQSYYYHGYPYAKDRTEQAWVYSFNVADPQNLVLVDKLKIFEGGGAQSGSGGSSVSRWFQGVAISATANTLHVVENWQTYGYVSGGPYQCGSWQSLQQAVVSIVDISDPQGSIRLHSRFETYGHLGDQFKQTYFRDEASGRGYYLGIFARREWSSTACQGSSLIRNTLETWDITDGQSPKRLAQLPFGKENETVRGSAFDTERRVVYAITARQVDPLYAISFADPAQPAILSAIDGLAGDMSVFRLIGNNQFLIGIGRDGSSSCTGFGTPATGWATDVAVSIIDVRSLSKVRLVQRRCVTVKDASWVGSEVSWNLDQAHKLIGMHSDGRENVISVPVSYYTRTGPDDWWWYRYQSAVGLMTWDLDKYDPTKSELEQQVLRNWGTVVHPHGQVRRSIVFTHQGPTPRRMMVNLSDTHVSVVDIESLAAPVQQSVVEVAPFHSRLYRFGSFMVDEVRQGGPYEWMPGASEFRVLPAGGLLEEKEPVASFTVGQVQQVIQWKDNLVLFRRPQENGRFSSAEVLVYDLSDPTRPRKRGSVQVEGLSVPYYPYACGDWGRGYWFNYSDSSFALTDRGLATLAWSYSGSEWAQKLVALDLSDTSSPRATATTLGLRRWGSKESKQYLGVIADPSDGGGVFVTSRERLGSFPLRDSMVAVRYRYLAERWDHGPAGLAHQYSVNVPGRLTRTWERNGSRQFLTNDSAYSWVAYQGYSGGYYRPNPRLHLLASTGQPIDTLDGVHAQLLDSLELADFQLQGLIGDADRLYLNLRRDWYYVQAHQKEAGADSFSDELMILDLSAGSLKQTFAGAIGTWYVQLMGVYQGRLFVSMPGDGVLVVDVSDPAKPAGQQFVRTRGWTSHIVFSGSSAYATAGSFGIYQLDLDAPPSIAPTG